MRPLYLERVRHLLEDMGDELKPYKEGSTYHKFLVSLGIWSVFFQSGRRLTIGEIFLELRDWPDVIAETLEKLTGAGFIFDDGKSVRFPEQGQNQKTRDLHLVVQLVIWGMTGSNQLETRWVPALKDFESRHISPKRKYTKRKILRGELVK